MADAAMMQADILYQPFERFKRFEQFKLSVVQNGVYGGHHGKT
jgi:hypothetical protein